MFVLWSLGESKSLQVSRTLLGIQTDLNNTMVWIVTIFPLISNSSSPELVSHVSQCFYFKKKKKNSRKFHEFVLFPSAVFFFFFFVISSGIDSERFISFCSSVCFCNWFAKFNIQVLNFYSGSMVEYYFYHWLVLLLHKLAILLLWILPLGCFFIIHSPFRFLPWHVSSFNFWWQSSFLFWQDLFINSSFSLLFMWTLMRVL